MSLSMYYFCNDLNAITKDYMNIGMFVDERNPVLSQIEELAYTELSLNQKVKEAISLSKEYTILFSLKEMEKKQIMEILNEMNISYDFKESLQPGIHFIDNHFRDGFIAHKEKIAVYTSQELFNVVHHRDLFKNKFK